MRLHSLLTGSLFYSTAKESRELRTHFAFPCSVTLEIEFSRKKFSLNNSKDWRVWNVYILRLIMISQLKCSIFCGNKLTHFWETTPFYLFFFYLLILSYPYAIDIISFMIIIISGHVLFAFYTFAYLMLYLDRQVHISHRLTFTNLRQQIKLCMCVWWLRFGSRSLRIPLRYLAPFENHRIKEKDL